MPSILGVLVSALLVVGCAGATPSAAPAASAPAASASGAGAFGGAVQFKYHGKGATTKGEPGRDGTNVSGTAVTDIGGASDVGKGTHTVQLGCAAKAGDMWAVAAKTEASNGEGGRAGDWSAVIVKPGSPAKIGIWVSDDASSASDCGAWLKGIDFSTIDIANFETVESGTLTAPAGLAP